MEKLTLSIPTLFGDHHTTAVRQILEGMSGVAEVHVSAAFGQVSLKYDPDQAKPEAIQSALGEQGYEPGAGELTFPSSATERATRHSAAIVTAGESLAFHEAAPSWEGRPLWPCPGMSVSPVMDEDA